MTSRKGAALPAGHGDTRDDAIKFPGPFAVDGTVKPRDAVILANDEKTLNRATTSQVALAGVLPYFDGSEANWGSTTPSEDTAYPTTVIIPYIFVHGHVKGRYDASEMGANKQLGTLVDPRLTGFGTNAMNGTGMVRHTVMADLLGEDTSDVYGEFLLT